MKRRDGEILLQHEDSIQPTRHAHQTRPTRQPSLPASLHSPLRQLLIIPRHRPLRRLPPPPFPHPRRHFPLQCHHPPRVTPRSLPRPLPLLPHAPNQHPLRSLHLPPHPQTLQTKPPQYPLPCSQTRFPLFHLRPKCPHKLLRNLRLPPSLP